MRVLQVRIPPLLTQLVLLAWGASSLAGEPGPAKKPLTESQCKRLVEQLVNPGKRPFSENYVFDLPEGATSATLFKTQQRIRAAYNELSDNIEVALPILVKHIDDPRFSYVYEEGISGVYKTANVGTACSRIIDAHVESYREPVTKRDSDGRSESLWFIDDECDGIEKWWKTRKGRTLADLQLEGIEWARSHSKPAYFSKKEWASAKKTLKGMADRIGKSKKPILIEHHVRFFPR